MPDQRATLAELADAVGRGTDDGSLDSERAVQLRAVEPLLETLDWDVRGPDVVPEADLCGLTIEYLLQIEETPSVAVRTVEPGTDSLDDAASQLESVLVDGRPSRGIVTDGHSIALLLIEGGDAHRRTISFVDLPYHAEALGQFHRSVLEEAATHDHADRRAAAQRLAENRDAVEDAVTAEIVSETGSEFRDVVAAESSSTIDAILEALDPTDDPERGSAEVQAEQLQEGVDSPEDSDGGVDVEDRADGEGPDEPRDEASDAAESESTPEQAKSTGRSTAGTTKTDRLTNGSSTDGSGAGSDGSSPRGEYVVRFFGGASSVGAVGTQSPTGTVVGTVRYLLENHDLESSLTLPWQTSSGATLLAASGESPDWTTLENAQGKAVAVHLIDDPAIAREGIEELADAAGLRVMFQGDW